MATRRCVGQKLANYIVGLAERDILRDAEAFDAREGLIVGHLRLFGHGSIEISLPGARLPTQGETPSFLHPQAQLHQPADGFGAAGSVLLLGGPFIHRFAQLGGEADSGYRVSTRSGPAASFFWYYLI